MSAELILDSLIRSWVFLPIALITFLTGVVRHYTTLYLSNTVPDDLSKLKDNQIILRSMALRNNCKYIPKSGFLMRKEAFIKQDTGYLQAPNPSEEENNIGDLCCMNSLSDVLKNNFTVVMPAIAIGAWINSMLSGFLTTKIPFPLTLQFRTMLQADIELEQLDASWVSSVSWYFLNVVGMKNLFTLFLGQENAADESVAVDNQWPMNNYMSDMQQVFKAEQEALKIVRHNCVICKVELPVHR